MPYDGKIPRPAAFSLRNLSHIAYGQGFTLWHYNADRNSLNEVLAPGFFDLPTNMRRGDMVCLSARDGGAQAYVLAVADDVPVLAPMLSMSVSA